MNATQATPIAQAVEPLRAAAIERARKTAAELVERTFAKHAEDPKFHNYPVGIHGRREYAEQKSRYKRFQALTVKGQRCEAKVTAFIDDAGDAASAQYTAFVMKLEHKVGAHVAAALEGNHVWGFSILTITKADGSTESWQTQQIVNVSVLGTLFNQWPTRKLKSSKRAAA